MTGPRRPKLFFHYARTLGLALIALELLTVAAIAFFVLTPMARRSADDLAALAVLSAQTWVELPPETRPAFEAELMRNHGLTLEPDSDAPLPEARSWDLYLRFLESSLEARMQRDVRVHAVTGESTWYWCDLSVGGRTIRVGFPASRLGTAPARAALAVIIVGLLVVLATAAWLARRMSTPLLRLSDAAARVGRGETAVQIPETGPGEFAELARDFNRMAREVEELLANRTTLLAGISHDLRTPIARMRLAVEMLPESTDPKLIARLTRDLEEMNRLIGEFLVLARGMECEPAQEIDLGGLAGRLAASVRERGIDATCTGSCGTLAAGPNAIERILSNLVENAVRYGEGRPIEIACGREAGTRFVAVRDRGPGIPEAEREAVFRPFHRLESSRGKETGGSGLGLAIVRQLADANGWRVELRAREGGGTEARLNLVA